MNSFAANSGSLNTSASKAERERAARTQRRIGRVRHDERGNGFIEWEPAPPGYVRELLEVIEEPSGFDPYNKEK